MEGAVSHCWGSVNMPIRHLSAVRRIARAALDKASGFGALVSAKDLPLPIGQREVNKVISQLLPRRRAFVKPANVDAVCVLLFASRCGSTWLGQLLGSTGQINTLSEEIKAKRLARYASRHGIEELSECVESVMSAHAVGGLYGFKGGIGSLVPFVYSGAYDAYKNGLRLILMFRADIVHQAISIQKAKLTGVWHGHRLEQPPVPADAYDYRAILRAITNIATANARLREFVVRNGHEHMEVTYEELCADQVAQVKAILAFLGRDPERCPPLSAKARILRDETNSLWSQRFQADLASQRADLDHLRRLGVLEFHNEFVYAG